MNTSELMVDGRHFVRWEHGWAEQIAHSRKPVPAKWARVLDEIAKLRAERDEARSSEASPAGIGVYKSEIFRLDSLRVDLTRERDEARADLAAARAALDAYKSPEAAHNLAMRAIEESHRANRAEAALKAEKAECDKAARIMTRRGDHMARAIWLSDWSARRAAEARDMPLGTIVVKRDGKVVGRLNAFDDEAKDHLTGPGKMAEAKEGA